MARRLPFQRVSGALVPRLFLIAAMISGAIGWPLQARGQQYSVDNATSAALTSYLREHRLPLVGAQVLKNASGGERLVLYGFVATNSGKQDARRKALEYLRASGIPVENRIAVRPEIAKLGSNSTGAASPGQPQSPASESIDSVLDDIQRYGVKSAPDEDIPGAR